MTDRNSEGVSIEMLSLPELGGVIIYNGEHTAAFTTQQMETYGIAMAEHNVAARNAEIERLKVVAHGFVDEIAAKDAEIEALRAEVEVLRASSFANATVHIGIERDQLKARAERLAEALRLIAAPIRPDGTWNRGREACRQIARDALRDHDQEDEK